MESFSTRRVAKAAVVAAMYVVLVLLMPELSYGEMSLRISEALVLLCLYSRDYIYSVTIACFIVNIFSPVGYIDVFVGTSATFLSALCIYLSRHRLGVYTASLFPIVINPLFLGVEFSLVFGTPIFKSIANTVIGTIICVSLFGGTVLKALSTSDSFIYMITNQIEKDNEWKI